MMYVHSSSVPMCSFVNSELRVKFLT